MLLVCRRSVIIFMFMQHCKLLYCTSIRTNCKQWKNTYIKMLQLFKIEDNILRIWNVRGFLKNNFLIFWRKKFYILKYGILLNPWNFHVLYLDISVMLQTGRLEYFSPFKFLLIYTIQISHTMYPITVSIFVWCNK